MKAGSESWQCMCASATTESAVFGVLFVATRVCPLALPPVAIAGHVINLPLTREYISVNVKAAYSCLQTMWRLWRLVGVQVQYPAERSTSLL